MVTALAGRPGSWEADLVEQLLRGTVGWDEQYLSEHRTEPVVIHLNVARLVEDEAWARTSPGDAAGVAGSSSSPADAGYEHDMDQVYLRWDSLSADEYDPDAEANEAQPSTS
ncbi:MAG TPA: hypothetical protein VEW45_06275, partial [Candidatus Dormibacteraeota bacterium]|nr:hypothetical protein [Candidatus Dormibacteraeota bacterium]